MGKETTFELWHHIKFCGEANCYFGRMSIIKLDTVTAQVWHFSCWPSCNRLLMLLCDLYARDRLIIIGDKVCHHIDTFGYLGFLNIKEVSLPLSISFRMLRIKIWQHIHTCIKTLHCFIYPILQGSLKKLYAHCKTMVAWVANIAWLFINQNWKK